MAVPKYKHSKARTRRRNSINGKLRVARLVTCSNCGSMKMPHRVCSKCGFYKGRQIFEPKDLD